MLLVLRGELLSLGALSCSCDGCAVGFLPGPSCSTFLCPAPGRAGLRELHQWARFPLAWQMGEPVQRQEGRRARLGDLFLCSRPAGLWVFCMPLSQAPLHPIFSPTAPAPSLWRLPSGALPREWQRPLLCEPDGLYCSGQCPLTLPTSLQKSPLRGCDSEFYNLVGP